MTEKLAYRFPHPSQTLLICPFERAVKVEHRTVVKGRDLSAPAFHYFTGDAVHRPPHITINHMALAVRG
jgi:hypothetical protein